MSKFDDLRKQNPEWDINLFDLIKKADPSDSNRYVAFILKCIKNYIKNPDDLLKSIGGLFPEKLQQFHIWYNEGLIDKKDISQYKNIDDFSIQYGIAQEKVKLREAEKKIHKIHEDDIWLIMLPTSYESAVLYGKSTKWCITQKRHWDDYRLKNFFIYIINKKTGEKYCINKNIYENNYKCWNANDNEIDLVSIQIPPELFIPIIKEIKENHLPVGTDMEEIKRWTTADGEELLIEDMNISHLRNAINRFRHSSSSIQQAKVTYMRTVLLKKEEEQKEVAQLMTALTKKPAMENDAFDDIFGDDDTDELPF